MYTIRCTERVLKRTGIKPETEVPAATTALGDWYVNHVYIGNKQYLLFTSEVTRLAVITLAREMRSMAKHLAEELPHIIRAFGAKEEWIEKELSQMDEVHYSKTNNRRILGTMNDYKYQMGASVYYDGGFDMMEESIRLSQTPIGHKVYFFPNKLTIELLEKKYGSHQ